MMHLLTPCCYAYLYECIHHVSSCYTCTHVCIRNTYAIFMHLGSEEEITLLKFDEVEEGDQQENPQVAAPEGEEQNPEELPECPDHRPTSFLRGKPGAF